MLNFYTIYNSPDFEDFKEYFDSFDNIFTSSLTIVAFPLVIIAPLHIAFIIYVNFETIEHPDTL